MDFVDFKAHFSKEYCPEIVAFARDNTFKNYVFIESKLVSKRRVHTGYCTYCNHDFRVMARLKQNEETTCPLCRKTATVKLAGLGRKYMIDYAYFVYYEKSIINPKVLVARGICAAKDYRGDYKKVPIQMKDRSLYVFEMGKATMHRRYVWYKTTEGKPKMEAGAYTNCDSIYSDFSQYWNNANTMVDYSRKSIELAVKGTPFQYSTWEQYDYKDMTEFFDLYSKYPCIEYLTKAGMELCVKDKLYGRNTYGAINWKGKTFLKVLRLKNNDIKALRASGYIIDSYFLRLVQLSKNDGSGLSFAELKEIEHAFNASYYKDIMLVRKFSSLRKSFGYIRRQYDLSNKRKNGRYHSICHVLTDYRDYLKDCVSLGLDMNSENVLFPKDLHNAHQNTIKQVKLKADETLNNKIAKRYEALNKKYGFEFNGIFIRPAASSNELINEGKDLSHCVGTYAERYANGSTNILLVRRVDEPDKPYYTMEITNSGQIMQTRGKCNCSVQGEMVAFMEAFRKKLEGKEQSNQVRIMIPA